MMSEFDWIIEQEELPPDEPYRPPPEPQPPQGLRIPTWAWVVGGVVAVAGVILVILWSLGGEDEPLPAPRPELASLRAAVELEINALNNGDREIYERQQDTLTRRSNYQPPMDVWFGGEARPGQFSLIDLRSVGNEDAQANVRLDWRGTPYRLVWNYRQDGGRWVHTDWLPGQLTTTLSLTTTHLVIEYHPEEADEAAVLAERTETFISSLCGLMTCPGEPIRVALAFDPVYLGPRVDENGDYIRMPSPLRFRWPLNGDPEPLVMGSLARHLAQRLVMPPAPADLSQENRDAMSLVVFWLAHRLLDLEALPGTTWLEEVDAREGIAAVAELAEAMVSNASPQQVVRERLRPETLAAVMARPDYLEWVALMSDPFTSLRAYDDVADPWAPAGESYRGVHPELVEIIYRGDWAIGLTAPESAGQMAVFFEQQNDQWRVLYSPGESLIGESKELVAGPFQITYYEWDEPHIDQIADMLTETYDRVRANFGLAEVMTITVMIVPYPSWSGRSSEIMVQWPTLNGWIGEPPISDQTLLMVAGSVLSSYVGVEELGEERYFTVIGLFLWQLEDLEISSDRWYRMIEFPAAAAWQPPRTVDDERWVPLTQLWVRPTQEPSEEEMAQLLWAPYLLTTYVVETYGREKVKIMADGLMTADSVDAWLESVTGESRLELEMKWRRWVIDQWENW
jgi:hypothetical protein